jgi:hypothetical protein
MPTDRTQGFDASTADAAPIRRKKPLLTYILSGLAAIVVVLVAVIAMRPSDFRVTRAATMSATPAEVFTQVNNFHNWEAWSPWIKIDPDAKTSYKGPTTGEGAYFSWNGNSEVGEGSMKIVESRPNDLIRIKLDFVRPFAGSNDVQFTFNPAGDHTNVTWSIAGKNNFMSKAVGLFLDCEKLTGDMFEQGLASMKSIVESPPQL